jgi:O-antigen/teichoic acid export membrane protein
VFTGRVLPPADFAIVQTLNAVLLVVVTAFAVWQPVVARFFAAEKGDGDAPDGWAAFHHFIRLAFWLGMGLTLLAWVGSRQVGTWLNVPAPAVAVSAAVLLLALLRPVVAGALQGQQRFFAFGLSRFSFAIGRLAVAVVLVGVLGGGALAGAAAFPLAALFSLVAALAFVGRSAGQPAAALPLALRRQGWRLASAALIAYASYMALQSLDMVWVNREFAPPVAAGYATVVLLRRTLVLLPGAVSLVLYPRLVAAMSAGRLPDALLARATAVITVPTLVLAAPMSLWGGELVGLLFGGAYGEAGALLGPLALAMVGFGLTAIWLNLYLAARPWPFVATLVLSLVAQTLCLTLFHAQLGQIIWAFTLGGWLPALAGLGLYLAWLRPALSRQATATMAVG